MNANKNLLAFAATLALLALAPSAAHAGFSRESVDQTCLLRWVRRSTTTAARCVSCHDGSVAFGTHVGRGTAIGPAGNHSVDVSYALARLKGRKLTPEIALPREMVLVNGTVSCTTCHDGDSREPHRIATAARRLCQACHEE